MTDQDNKLKGLALAAVGDKPDTDTKPDTDADTPSRASLEEVLPLDPPGSDEEPQEEPSEFPTPEEVCAHLARHPSERYAEIINMMEQAIAIKGPGNTPSMAEILAQREAEEVGPAYHGFMGLIERVEKVRQAVGLVAKALDTMANHPAVHFSLGGLSEARDLLEAAKPGEIAPDDAVEEPEEGQGVEA